MSNILLVEDDKDLTLVMREFLECDHNRLDVLHDGHEAWVHIQKTTYDLIILDWSLPGLSGLEVCRRYRLAQGRAPILMLTGRSEMEDKLHGLDAGADDYMTKPFSSNELLARIRAHLRRAPKEQQEMQLIELGDFRIDLNTRVVAVRGREVKLTPKEFDLLVFLAKSPGRVLTHRALLSAVWGGPMCSSPSICMCSSIICAKSSSPRTARSATFLPRSGSGIVLSLAPTRKSGHPRPLFRNN